MQVQFIDGKQHEAILLARTENSMRIAIEGGDDVVELNLIRGVWVTPDCEPVRVRFAWEKEPAAEVSEQDCICPPELAARLIHLLHTTEEQEAAKPAPLAVSAAAAFLPGLM